MIGRETVADLGRALGVVTAAVSLCFVGRSMADDVHTPIKKQTNIPAEGLGPALQALAKDRHFQIVYVSEQINVLRTKGVSGELTPEEALQGLLNGTGFTFRYLDEKTVTIVPAGTRSDAMKSAAAATPEASAAAPANEPPHEGKKSFWDRLRLGSSCERSVGTRAIREFRKSQELELF